MSSIRIVLHVDDQEYRVDYLPAESNTGMFGGNSNWRGPVWMPVNVMIIRALLNFIFIMVTTSRSSVQPVQES